MILLVGCGKMGGALMRGWLAGGVAPNQIVVVEPNPAPDMPEGVYVVNDSEMIPMTFPVNVAVLAVKPQQMDAVLPAYRRYETAVFLSIAAGRPLKSFAKPLTPWAAVVRAMPNTPVAVGRGMTVMCANDRARDRQRRLCQEIMELVGEVGWIEDESLMDAVTAVSGSGPAYVFLMAECLAKAGVAAGLPEDLAIQLARATLAGGGELLRCSKESAATLRKNVTSPNGTTAAALEVLMAEDALQPLLTKAVAAAAHRSRELAGS